MKYLVTFFWTFILGEVVGYIGSALLGVSYDATQTSIVAALIGTLGAIMVYAISKSATPEKVYDNVD
ncbi:MAG: YjzD family protein [Lactobacillaceae bacterium]|jgi:uncharacterized membrane protein YeaQ/YmgE (transglycosylase-associated protein family)|nr:YjzD family protein [Lactobacillaceae bacterium]